MTFSDILLSEFEKSLVCRDFQSGDTLAWEAVVLPIYESCVCAYYSRQLWKKQPLFVGDREGFLFEETFKL